MRERKLTICECRQCLASSMMELYEEKWQGKVDVGVGVRCVAGWEGNFERGLVIVQGRECGGKVSGIEIEKRERGAWPEEGEGKRWPCVYVTREQVPEVEGGRWKESGVRMGQSMARKWILKLGFSL